MSDQLTILTVVHFCSPASSESESDDSSISGDSDSEHENIGQKLEEIVQSIMDDDEDALTQGQGAYSKTENEITDDEIMVPDILQVDPSEPLEKVGEISSILNNKIVIIKGIASQIKDRGSDRALDSDTLLVFEDRRVLGFVSGLSITPLILS
jgi:H/ACA ribonucleoprotein complex non-core subunit NAF1